MNCYADRVRVAIDRDIRCQCVFRPCTLRHSRPPRPRLGFAAILSQAGRLRLDQRRRTADSIDGDEIPADQAGPQCRGNCHDPKIRTQTKSETLHEFPNDTPLLRLFPDAQTRVTRDDKQTRGRGNCTSDFLFDLAPPHRYKVSVYFCSLRLGAGISADCFQQGQR
jgi:hypothetical protein